MNLYRRRKPDESRASAWQPRPNLRAPLLSSPRGSFRHLRTSIPTVFRLPNKSGARPGRASAAADSRALLLDILDFLKADQTLSREWSRMIANALLLNISLLARLRFWLMDTA